MDAIFINSEQSKTSDRYRLNLSDKKNLKRKDKYVALSNLSIYYTRKNIKKSSKKPQNKIKYYLPHGTKSLSYLMGHVLYQIFWIILNIF